MSGGDDHEGTGDPATRYAPGNTREDGSYKVGKNRTPEETRFRVGDGRRRGRRPKGQRNFDTEFLEESQRRITVRENGRERRVTKQRGTIIRTFDSALTKADARSASLIFSHLGRIGDRQSGSSQNLAPDDDAELNSWLRDRLTLIESSEPDDAAPEERSDGS